MAEVCKTEGLEIRKRCCVRRIAVLSLMAGGGFYERVAQARRLRCCCLCGGACGRQRGGWFARAWDMFEMLDELGVGGGWQSGGRRVSAAADMKVVVIELKKKSMKEGIRGRGAKLRRENQIRKVERCIFCTESWFRIFGF